MAKCLALCHSLICNLRLKFVSKMFSEEYCWMKAIVPLCDRCTVLYALSRSKGFNPYLRFSCEFQKNRNDAIVTGP